MQRSSIFSTEAKPPSWQKQSWSLAPLPDSVLLISPRDRSIWFNWALSQAPPRWLLLERLSTCLLNSLRAFWSLCVCVCMQMWKGQQYSIRFVCVCVCVWEREIISLSICLSTLFRIAWRNYFLYGLDCAKCRFTVIILLHTNRTINYNLYQSVAITVPKICQDKSRKAQFTLIVIQAILYDLVTKALHNEGLPWYKNAYKYLKNETSTHTYIHTHTTVRKYLQRKMEEKLHRSVGGPHHTGAHTHSTPASSTAWG